MIRPTKNIKVKIKLTGSITGKLNGSTIVVEPELENLEVTPSTEEQVFKSEKYGFDEVRVNGITAEIDKDIKPENIKAGINILGVEGGYEGVDTSDATATVGDIASGKTAYVNGEKIEGIVEAITGSKSLSAEKVFDFGGSVAMEAINEKPVLFKKNSKMLVAANYDKFVKAIKLTSDKIVEGNTVLGVSGSVKIPDTSDATATPNDILVGKTAYSNNEKIEGTIQKYDGAYSGEVGNRPENAIINTSYQPITYVSGGDNSTLNQLLTKVPNIDTSNFTQLNYMYYRCDNLIEIPEVDAQKAQYFASVYENCKNVKKLSIKNTSNIISFSKAFRDCLLLEEISVLDGTKANNIENTFYRCNSLKKFDGIINLGKAYTQKTENYYKYVFNLSQSVLLTHESLINIINNLYDLNLTYDVANGGTLYRQQLVLGSTNLAKLTEEEIAIATNKGWNVS